MELFRDCFSYFWHFCFWINLWRALKTKNGAGYGIHVRSDAEHLIEMELDITLQLNRKDIKPLFNVGKNEGDK